MAIANFKPEIWAAELLVALEKSLVYAGPGVVNRDYEGEIATTATPSTSPTSSTPPSATTPLHRHTIEGPPTTPRRS